ncbi:MAG: (d)CMP kinase [Candidatus Latescibacteria bacterium]|nr:(d)CMP kinase [Candidatus Latescibacterota bacterium]
MRGRKPIIAIDGPVGAGKSTTARRVAEELCYLYVDTGAMYRAVTLDVLDHGIDPEDEIGVEDIVCSSKIELMIDDRGQRTFLNGKDVSERIRDRDVTKAVSSVSAMKAVRDRMTELQRELGFKGGIVMEGRDIGTVVFPDAEFKIYLDASPEIRAQRRYEELSAKGATITYNKLLDEIKERDRLNTMREIAPLRKAEDAITVDTTNLTLEEQVREILLIVKGENEAGKK